MRHLIFCWLGEGEEEIERGSYSWRWRDLRMEALEDSISHPCIRSPTRPSGSNSAPASFNSFWSASHSMPPTSQNKHRHDLCPVLFQILQPPFCWAGDWSWFSTSTGMVSERRWIPATAFCERSESSLHLVCVSVSVCVCTPTLNLFLYLF